MSLGNGKRNRSVACQCLRCAQAKLHEARGLCKPCYNRVHEQGRLDEYPASCGGGGLAPVVATVALDPAWIARREAYLDSTRP